MRDFIPNKKEHRSDYFKVIDSEVKAYILGYLVADGSIEDKDATVFLKRKRDKALNTVLNAVDKRTAQCNA